MKHWQKGVLYGFLFILALSFVYTSILIYIDLRLESQGSPHMCFLLSESVFCSFSEAIETRIAFFFIVLLAFGLPISFLGGMLGYLFDKIKIG